jgi:hypothetical protein
MSEFETSNEFEARLSEWRPAASRLSRDQLMFEAGSVFGRRKANRSLAVAIGSAVLVVGSFAGLAAHEHVGRMEASEALAQAKVVIEQSREIGIPMGPNFDSRLPDPNSYLILTRNAARAETEVFEQIGRNEEVIIDAGTLTPRSSRDANGLIEL